ncbi:hypothetical protein BDN67DRAFT_1014297 [Paxillus ammoniavirescens]|nr:hypothetical protein BDN67DRAFT_1014297 [Paxillus ammoniavirescens]
MEHGSATSLQMSMVSAGLPGQCSLLPAFASSLNLTEDMVWKEEDYPMLKMSWTKTEWQKQKSKSKGVAEPSSGLRKQGSSRMAKGKNVAMQYVQDENGTSVSAERAKAMHETAAGYYEELQTHNIASDTWGSGGLVIKETFYQICRDNLIKPGHQTELTKHPALATASSPNINSPKSQPVSPPQGSPPSAHSPAVTPPETVSLDPPQPPLQGTISNPTASAPSTAMAPTEGLAKIAAAAKHTRKAAADVRPSKSTTTAKKPGGAMRISSEINGRNLCACQWRDDGHHGEPKASFNVYYATLTAKEKKVFDNLAALKLATNTK